MFCVYGMLYSSKGLVLCCNYQAFNFRSPRFSHITDGAFSFTSYVSLSKWPRNLIPLNSSLLFTSDFLLNSLLSINPTKIPILIILLLLLIVCGEATRHKIQVGGQKYVVQCAHLKPSFIRISEVYTSLSHVNDLVTSFDA